MSKGLEMHNMQNMEMKQGGHDHTGKGKGGCCWLYWFYFNKFKTDFINNKLII